MQPKSVLYDYLSDLMGQPDNGKASVEQAPENSRSAPPLSIVSSYAEAVQSEPATVGERTAEGFREEQNRQAAAAPSGMPGWAVDPFQVLIIRAHGFDLAVPLHQLDSIVRWNGHSTWIPGQPRWQRGLFLYKQSKVRLVDLSRLIMPDRQLSDAPSSGYLLLIGGARWGLTCDSIHRPRLLRAEEVRWSRNRKIRPWSHGIMVENLSVLLNVDALLAELGMNDA